MILSLLIEWKPRSALNEHRLFHLQPRPIRLWSPRHKRNLRLNRNFHITPAIPSQRLHQPSCRLYRRRWPNPASIVSVGWPTTYVGLSRQFCPWEPEFRLPAIVCHPSGCSATLSASSVLAILKRTSWPLLLRLPHRHR